MQSRREIVFISLALLIGMSAPLAAAAAEFRVGANIGNVPWEFEDASGGDVGFEVDLVNEIGKRLGLVVSIVNIPFSGLFAAVESGQIDAAVSSITISKRRLESVVLVQIAVDREPILAGGAGDQKPSTALQNPAA